MQTHIKLLLSLAIIACLGILVYSNSFDCAFQADDIFHIVESLDIRHIDQVNSWWNHYPSRPVGYFTFVLNYHFHQLDVRGYHLVNLFIHVANGWLVLWLVLLILNSPAMRNHPLVGFRIELALLAALIFIAHPVQTQAVTYIIQRFCSLATFFYLLSINLYLSARLAAMSASKKIIFFTGAFLAAILGMLTKEIVFTLPVAIMALEIYFVRTENWRLIWRSKYTMLGIAILLITLLIIPLLFNFETGKVFAPRQAMQGSTETITVQNYLFTQFRVLVTYLRLLVLPIQQNLDYDYPISHTLLEWKTLLSFLFLSALLLSSIWLFKINRLLSFAIVWFYLTLSVESSIIPIPNVIFEHRLYLPSVGYALGLAGIIIWSIHRIRFRYIAAGLSLIILAYGSATYLRNEVWKTEYSLWEDVVKKSPNKPRPLASYACELEKKGELDKAKIYFEKALSLNPNYEVALNDYGNFWLHRGDYLQAISYYQKALTVNPDFVRSYQQLATAYYQLGQMETAIQYLEKVVALQPNNAEALNNLGTAWFIQKDYVNARYYYQQALNIDPNHPLAQTNLQLLRQHE